MNPPATVLEIKHTLDGRTQTFACTAVFHTPRLIVVRFAHPGERRAGGFHFPAGSHTLGFFWRARSYNLYRITGPDENVIAYRFDVMERVRITPRIVGYHDLLLDLWVNPAGVVAVEDEDEVRAAQAAGLLTPRQHATIERTRSLLERGHARIIAECEQLIAGLPQSR